MQPVLVRRKKGRERGGELGSGPRPGEAPHLPPTVSAVAASQAPPSSPEAETLTLCWPYNPSPVNSREAACPGEEGASQVGIRTAGGRKNKEALTQPRRPALLNSKCAELPSTCENAAVQELLLTRSAAGLSSQDHRGFPPGSLGSAGVVFVVLSHSVMPDPLRPFWAVAH